MTLTIKILAASHGVATVLVEGNPTQINIAAGDSLVIAGIGSVVVS